MSSQWLLSLLQGLLFIALAPLITGALTWGKARRQGRRRPVKVMLQPYFDLVKLMRTPAVRPQTASWLLTLTPYALFAGYGLLAFTLPLFTAPLLTIDVLVLIYLLAATRFILSLAGWDAGASFGNLGGSREMYMQFLTELTLTMTFIGLALRWGQLDLTVILEKQGHLFFMEASQQMQNLGLLFLLPAMAIAVFLEAGRIPVDNPATHLELTMANKAVLLEFAGRDLALLEAAEAIKLTFLLVLFAQLFLVPLAFSNWAINAAILVLRLAAAIFLLVWWETSRPKLRLGILHTWSGNAIVFALIAIVIIGLTKGVFE